MHDYPFLIPLAPLAAALLTALPGRSGERRYQIGALAHVVAFGIAVELLYQTAARDAAPTRFVLFASPWSFLPSVEMAVDRLASVMMVVVSGIGTLLYLYSIRFMQQERGRARYQTLLALSVSALLFMVSSADLVVLFVSWQILSWLLPLLAHNYAHPPTAQSSFRTFVMLRAGDVAFLAGIVLAYRLYGTVEFSQLFIRSAADKTVFPVFGPDSGLEISGTTAVTLLIFIGAMSKSAQFPLHMWLPDSLYAPTPIHGLLHAGIINAGGFLLNRLAPLYGRSPATLHVVFAVGLLTALTGASMMLTQSDIKKTLGYSTIGQMGFMVMECGLGAFGLAVFHLIAHGLFKATIFLNCGNVIQLARQEPRTPHGTHAPAPADFSFLVWATGCVTSLLMPLVILLASHGVLRIPLRDSQGLVIFLFFSWVTSSQAMLTLYRLRAVESWKVAGTMLLTLLLVMFTYLFAGERFTRFLYPAPGAMSGYLKAAALPGPLFDGMIAAAVLLIGIAWTVIFAKSHGRAFRLPRWASGIQARLYLLFINRLYLDGLAFRLSNGFRRAAERLDRSRLFLPVGALIAIGCAFAIATPAGGWSFEEAARTSLIALLLPLYPLHGVYVVALTRLPRRLAVVLCILLPAAGLYGLARLLPGLSSTTTRSIAVLALFGAIHGSIKALVQVRVANLLAYAGLALHSILWWHAARTGSVTPQAAVYAGAATLVTGGLLLGWERVRARHGDLDLRRIGGLAHPMPRLAVLMALLVMAAVGLPPFGLFSAYLAMLLAFPTTSVELTVVLLTWFAASWYLFKLMQRLLFGPHRPDLLYQDLRPAEVAPLVLMLVILVALGVLPHGVLEAGARAAMGFR